MHPRAAAAVSRRSVLLGGAAAGLGALAAACARSIAQTPTTGPGTGAAALVDPADARAAVRFGLNYTPSKHWWLVWDRWDPARVSDDLAQIASLGMDHVRAHLLWDRFQPAPDRVDTTLLGHLAQLLDLAGDHGLDVNVSVLTGYLSGHQFIPDWARAGNWVERPDLVAGELALFRAVGSAVGRHPRLMGLDLGNELLGRAPKRDVVELGEWSAQLLTAAREAAPGGVHSVSSSGTFLPPFPTLSATLGDVSVVHPWYFLSDTVADGKLRSDPLHHAEFNVEFMKAFHSYAPHEPRRRVWVQEVGAPSVSFFGGAAVPERFAAEFATAVYENVLGCTDVYGITWWDSHDIDTAAVPLVFHDPEPTLGVFDVHGRLKPVGAAIADVVKRWRSGALPLPGPRPVAVAGPDGRGFSRLLASGVRPAVVQPGLRDDTTYLRRRGIERVEV